MIGIVIGAAALAYFILQPKQGANPRLPNLDRINATIAKSGIVVSKGPNPSNAVEDSLGGGGLIGGPTAVFDVQGAIQCKELFAGGKMTPECEQALIARGQAAYNYGKQAVNYVGNKVEGAYSTVKGWF